MSESEQKKRPESALNMNICAAVITAAIGQPFSETIATNKPGNVLVQPSTNILPCTTAAPYWLDKPTNLVLAPDENGRLVCRANGNPKPSIQWLINGQPMDRMYSF